MPDDPLAPFRRKPAASPEEQPQQALTTHEALGKAIAALNEVPNSRVRMDGYATTYGLIPDLEKAYKAGEESTKLEKLAPQMYDTLLLCEDALTELGRTNDGTPSIQALINIQIIKKEAGYPLPGPDLAQAPDKPMTDAEIDAAVEHDVRIIREHFDIAPAEDIEPER